MNPEFEPEQDIGFGVGKKSTTNWAEDVRFISIVISYICTIFIQGYFASTFRIFIKILLSKTIKKDFLFY